MMRYYVASILKCSESQSSRRPWECKSKRKWKRHKDEEADGRLRININYVESWIIKWIGIGYRKYKNSKQNESAYMRMNNEEAYILSP